VAIASAEDELLAGAIPTVKSTPAGASINGDAVLNAKSSMRSTSSR
jgi:hypothetical protein